MLRLSVAALSFFFATTTIAQVPTESVDGTGLESVDGTGTESVDGTGLESVDGTGTESVDGTGTESVDGTGIQSAGNSGSHSYVVQDGDTLGSIAMRFLGSTAQWKLIYKANSDVLNDANTVPVGVTLTIPATE